MEEIILFSPQSLLNPLNFWNVLTICTTYLGSLKHSILTWDFFGGAVPSSLALPNRRGSSCTSQSPLSHSGPRASFVSFIQHEFKCTPYLFPPTQLLEGPHSLLPWPQKSEPWKVDLCLGKAGPSTWSLGGEMSIRGERERRPPLCTTPGSALVLHSVWRVPMQPPTEVDGTSGAMWQAGLLASVRRGGPWAGTEYALSTRSPLLLGGRGNGSHHGGSSARPPNVAATWLCLCWSHRSPPTN